MSVAETIVAMPYDDALSVELRRIVKNLINRGHFTHAQIAHLVSIGRTAPVGHSLGWVNDSLDNNNQVIEKASDEEADMFLYKMAVRCE